MDVIWRSGEEEAPTDVELLIYTGNMFKIGIRSPYGYWSYDRFVTKRNPEWWIQIPQLPKN